MSIKVPHLMSIRPMECWLATLNASSAIMYDNVTFFARSKNPAYTLASLYLCPADCFQDILFSGRVKVPHLISIRPMECWLATLDASSAIMSHALEQTNAARIRVSQNASSKLSASCLHGYSVSKRKFQGVFLEGDFRNTPDRPGPNNSHFSLENEDWKMSLVFSVWHPSW